MRGAPDYRKVTYDTDPEDIWGRQHYVGNAELAARMESADVFERNGTVFLIDDFDDPPLRWYSSFLTAGGGVGHSITRDTTHPYRGAGCMKVTTPNVVGNSSRAYRHIGGAAQHRMSMEMNITFEASWSAFVQIVMRCYTGTRQINSGIRLRQRGAGGLMYLNNTGANPAMAGAWTTFNDDFLLYLGATYPLKFVVDMENEQYMRCFFGGTEINMAQYTPYATNAGISQMIRAEAWIITEAAANISVYFDDFIFKIEEPEV